MSREKRSEISSSKLLASTTAAAAAVFAASDARAEVDHTDGPITFTGSNAGVGIDFNGDSGQQNATDFRETFVGLLSNDPNNSRVVLKVTEGPNETAPDSLKALVSTGDGLPVPLAFGTSIGASAPAGTQWGLVPSDLFTGFTLKDEAGAGHFNNSATPQYLGVQFAFASLPSAIHYAWIGLSDINPVNDAGGTITGYAYETSAATALGAGVVPEPTGLALIALGAAATGLRRRPK